jgi:hypothetical protein
MKEINAQQVSLSNVGSNLSYLCHGKSQIQSFFLVSTFFHFSEGPIFIYLYLYLIFTTVYSRNYKL